MPQPSATVGVGSSLIFSPAPKRISPEGSTITTSSCISTDASISTSALKGRARKPGCAGEVFRFAPRGLPKSFQHKGGGDFLVVHITPELLRQVAADMHLDNPARALNCATLFAPATSESRSCPEKALERISDQRSGQRNMRRGPGESARRAPSSQLFDGGSHRASTIEQAPRQDHFRSARWTTSNRTSPVI